MKTFQHLFEYLDEFFLEREIFQCCTENQNTHLKIRDFISSKIAPFMTMGKNVVDPGRPQMKIQFGACPLHVG